MKRLAPVCIGEFLGVLLLVLLGTSAVAVAVIFKAFSGLMEVALIWGLAVTLAIYGTRHLSCAHLNPAVSVGMVVAGRMDSRLLPWYLASQTVGGIAGGAVVFLLFGGQIAQFEAAYGIVRGSPESVRTAMMFGEYFPNPGMAPQWLNVSMGTAMCAEATGTFILVTMIFLLTEGCNVGRPADGLAPVFIGGTVAVIIGVLAPLTQAGINPARDFGPRLVAFLAGWGAIAIPGPHGGFLAVYVIAPLVGGVTAALCFRFLIMPLMNERSRALACACDPEARIPPATSPGTAGSQ
ncbi:MAG: MIP/aquaporin family protein [Thermodesulfobacteriota bacterium]